MEPQSIARERLRALTTELMTVVRRHAPDWTDHNAADPGITLLQLLTWLAEALSTYQDQSAGEAALDTRRKLGRIAHHVLSDASIVLTVDGDRWHPASPGSSEAADERTYVLVTGDDGSTTIRFGDGERGARPPGGSEVTATYRSGGGDTGLTVTVRWPPEARSVALELTATDVTFKPALRAPGGPPSNPSRAIVSIATAVTAFIGRAARGPVNDPVHVRSFGEYEREFGGLWVESTLSYAVHQYFLNGGREALIVRVGDGLGGAAITDSQITGDGLESARGGLWALEKADLFNILCIPPLSRTMDVDPVATLRPALAYCRARGAMLMVDPPSRWNAPADVLDPSTGLASLDLPGEDVINAALYFPRVLLPDPLNGSQLTAFAPCGMVAAVYARTDAQRGVWATPAGREATLPGGTEPVHRLTDAESDMLNSRGVNGLRAFPPASVYVWGGRTLAGADALASEWKYIPVRRFALFIEESIVRGTPWVVFEPNDEPLWAEIRMHVDDFMLGLFRQGALQGTVPEDAYFVRCGRDTMTQDDIEQRRLIILVGFAPLKPAEFVMLRIRR
jgi:hypothetical protein